MNSQEFRILSDFFNSPVSISPFHSALDDTLRFLPLLVAVTPALVYQLAGGVPYPTRRWEHFDEPQGGAPPVM